MVLVHWLHAAFPVINSNENSKKYIFFISKIWLVRNITCVFTTGISGKVMNFFRDGKFCIENIKAENAFESRQDLS